MCTMILIGWLKPVISYVACMYKHPSYMHVNYICQTRWAYLFLAIIWQNMWSRSCSWLYFGIYARNLWSITHAACFLCKPYLQCGTRACWSFVEKTSVKQSIKQQVCSKRQAPPTLSKPRPTEAADYTKSVSHITQCRHTQGRCTPL